MSDFWFSAKHAPENIAVWTKIDDQNGVRNVQRLERRGSLWWYPDGRMYVYYTPTHFSYHAPAGES